MTYELASKLKNAGFPNVVLNNGMSSDGETVKYTHITPTLSELIEACGEDFDNLTKGRFIKKGWMCNYAHDDQANEDWNSEGSTPEEAVANLWLELNKE